MTLQVLLIVDLFSYMIFIGLLFDDLLDLSFGGFSCICSWFYYLLTASCFCCLWCCGCLALFGFGFVYDYC